jgi:hypothetical protein
MRPRTLSIVLATVGIAGLVTSHAAAQQASAQSKSDARDYVLHPWALAELIDEIGGRQITLPKARVIAVLSPRVFLIESVSFLTPLPRHFDRVVVLVDRGSLRIEPGLIVESNVKILGIARTLVGMQMTREVPWPPELTREVLKRYEIRAAVLASSVQTADGVELTDRASR